MKTSCSALSVPPKTAMLNCVILVHKIAILLLLHCILPPSTKFAHGAVLPNASISSKREQAKKHVLTHRETTYESERNLQSHSLEDAYVFATDFENNPVFNVYAQGAMFDIYAKSDITIAGFDIHIVSEIDEFVEIWTREGSFEDYDMDPITWYMVLCAPMLGVGYLEASPVPNEYMDYIRLSEGETKGIYITMESPYAKQALMREQGSTGDVAIENDQIRMFVGVSKITWEFSSIDRMWNGNIYYFLGHLEKNEEDILVADCRPSMVPTLVPTFTPSLSLMPTTVPTRLPTVKPTNFPTLKPSLEPTQLPSLQPTAIPTLIPTLMPTSLPTLQPSAQPSASPIIPDSGIPTFDPTDGPTTLPSLIPTLLPSRKPSALPTLKPSLKPSSAPSFVPSTWPSMYPSKAPSLYPSSVPTDMPTFDPTRRPTIFNSIIPSRSPSLIPTLMPTVAPSVLPSAHPTSLPSTMPTLMPTLTPSTTPSTLPSDTPTEYPSESASGINVGLLSAVAAAGAGAAAAGGSGAAASAGGNVDQQMMVTIEDDGGENAFYSEDFEGGGEEEEMVEVEAEEDDNRRSRRGGSRRSLMGSMNNNAGDIGQNVSLAVAGAALANAGNVNLQRDQKAKQDSKWVSDDDGDGSTSRGDLIHSFRQNFLSSKSNRSLFSSTDEDDNESFIDDDSSISSAPQYFAPPTPILHSENRMIGSNSQSPSAHAESGLLQQMSARSLLSLNSCNNQTRNRGEGALQHQMSARSVLSSNTSSNESRRREGLQQQLSAPSFASSNAGSSEFSNRGGELQRSLYSLSEQEILANPPSPVSPLNHPLPQPQLHSYYESGDSNSVTANLRSSIRNLGRSRRAPTFQESLRDFGTGRLGESSFSIQEERSNMRHSTSNVMALQPQSSFSIQEERSNMRHSTSNVMALQPPPPQYYYNQPPPPVAHVMVDGYLVNGSFVPAGQYSSEAASVVTTDHISVTSNSVRDHQRNAIRRHFARENDGLRRSRNSRSFRETGYGGGRSVRSTRRSNNAEDDENHFMGYGISG